MTQPFADSVELYRSLGWTGVLWFAPFTKHPPPTGFTGRAGRDADDEQIAKWLRRDPAGNVGLRLPDDVIGVDVDAYGDKRGGETLDQAEQHIGSLPRTWLSTARDDGVSGIRWFRVPAGVRWLDRIPPDNSGIEIIQRTHRYAIVWPSIHPDTGTTYRWIDPQGLPATNPPRPEDLTELPQEWVEFLRRPDDASQDAAEVAGIPTGDDQPVTTLAGASSHFELVNVFVERIRNGAPRNDTGRDLALQLRDNFCSKADALRVWGPLFFQLLGELANAPGADGEPYEPGEWQATVNSIWSRPAREPLPGFVRGLGATPAGGRGPTDAALGSREVDPSTTLADDTREAFTTDLGNSLRFARLYRDRVRYVYGEDRWLIWDGRYWQPDVTNRVFDLTKGVIDQLRHEAENADQDEDRTRLAGWAIRSESLAARTATLRGAESEPGIFTRPDQIDADPNLLCVRNGTIDLRTGELLEHDPRHLISRMCPVDYDPSVGSSPLLEQFARTFVPDPKELAYVLKSFGYALLGGNPNRLLYIVIGQTTSGKSQFMEAVAAVLGPYAVPVGTSVFRANLDDKPRPDLIRALPSRLAYAEEASHSWELHTDQVKRLTGGSVVVARGMRSNTMVERIPSFTPLIVTNEMPRVRGADQAVRRRMVVLRFGHSLDPALEDPTIKQRFVSDERTRTALLTQLVWGCLRMQSEGWRDDMPINFMWATQEAFSALNHVGDFLEYMKDMGYLVEMDPAVIAYSECWRPVELYRWYADWVKNQGNAEDRRTILSERELRKQLKELGWESTRANGTYWVGKLRPQNLITPV